MLDLKPVVFRGRALDDLHAFPIPARRAAGYRIDQVQPDVLHCFQKKTQKTSKADIDLAAKRYRDLVRELGP